jgi:predicted dithiol-disulfide oxidoreductase (DUF899 family)
MPQSEIKKLEQQMFDISKKLTQLRRDSAPVEVKNYKLKTLEGEITLLDLFAGKDTLFLIHNMGQGCRYCTTWADGFNAFVPHIEDRFAIALVSKDDPETQRRMANDRGWRFRMASHAGTNYFQDQTGDEANPNHPGMVCYTRKGEKIYLKNRGQFGPGDQFCSLWSILSLAGHDDESWTPQFHYWGRPQKMDDGGQNLKD